MATDVTDIIKTGISVLPDIIRFAAAIAELIGKSNDAEDLRTIATRITEHADDQIKALDDAIAEDKAAEDKMWQDAAKPVPADVVTAAVEGALGKYGPETE